MKIPYEIENRDAFIAQLVQDGKQIIADSRTDIVNGRLSNCYVEVIDAPTGPTAEDLLAQADMTILDLTEQLILAKEGL